MRYIAIFAVALAGLLLTGCAHGPWWGPSAGVAVTPHEARVLVQPRPEQLVSVFSTPRLEILDRFNQWQQVWGNFTEIPGTSDGAMFRLVLGCTATTPLHGSYNGQLFDIWPNRWEFWLPNYRDGGDHVLQVIVTCKNPGQVEESVKYTFYVYNAQGL